MALMRGLRGLFEGKQGKAGAVKLEETVEVVEVEAEVEAKKPAEEQKAEEFFKTGMDHFERYKEAKTALQEKLDKARNELKEHREVRNLDLDKFLQRMKKEDVAQIQAERKNLTDLLNAAVQALKVAADQQHPDATAIYCLVEYCRAISGDSTMIRFLNVNGVAEMGEANKGKAIRDLIPVLEKTLGKSFSLLSLEMFATATLETSKPGVAKKYRETFDLLKMGVNSGDRGAIYFMAALVALAKELGYSAAKEDGNVLFCSTRTAQQDTPSAYMPIYHLLTYPDVMNQLRDTFAKRFTLEEMQKLVEEYKKLRAEGKWIGFYIDGQIEGCVRLINKHLLLNTSSNNQIAKKLGVDLSAQAVQAPALEPVTERAADADEIELSFLPDQVGESLLNSDGDYFTSDGTPAATPTKKRFS